MTTKPNESTSVDHASGRSVALGSAVPLEPLPSLGTQAPASPPSEAQFGYRFGLCSARAG